MKLSKMRKRLATMEEQLAMSERTLDKLRSEPREHNLTRAQVDNVCRHFGLSEWAECFARLTIGDYRIEDRDFSVFIRKAHVADECLEMLQTILGEDTIRECMGPKDVEALETVLAISRGA